MKFAPAFALSAGTGLRALSGARHNIFTKCHPSRTVLSRLTFSTFKIIGTVRSGAAWSQPRGIRVTSALTTEAGSTPRVGPTTVPVKRRRHNRRDHRRGGAPAARPDVAAPHLSRAR